MLVCSTHSLQVRQTHWAVLGQLQLADRGRLFPPCSTGEAVSGVLCLVLGSPFKRYMGEREQKDSEGPGAHDLQGEWEGVELG